MSARQCDAFRRDPCSVTPNAVFCPAYLTTGRPRFVSVRNDAAGTYIIEIGSVTAGFEGNLIHEVARTRVYPDISATRADGRAVFGIGNDAFDFFLWSFPLYPDSTTVRDFPPQTDTTIKARLREAPSCAPAFAALESALRVRSGGLPPEVAPFVIVDGADRIAFYGHDPDNAPVFSIAVVGRVDTYVQTNEFLFSLRSASGPSGAAAQCHVGSAIGAIRRSIPAPPSMPMRVIRSGAKPRSDLQYWRKSEWRLLTKVASSRAYGDGRFVSVSSAFLP
jgi:hypothetical protein